MLMERVPVFGEKIDEDLKKHQMEKRKRSMKKKLEKEKQEMMPGLMAKLAMLTKQPSVNVNINMVNKEETKQKRQRAFKK